MWENKLTDAEKTKLETMTDAEKKLSLKQKWQQKKLIEMQKKQ